MTRKFKNNFRNILIILISFRTNHYCSIELRDIKPQKFLLSSASPVVAKISKILWSSSPLEHAQWSADACRICIPRQFFLEFIFFQVEWCSWLWLVYSEWLELSLVWPGSVSRGHQQRLMILLNKNLWKYNVICMIMYHRCPIIIIYYFHV